MRKDEEGKRWRRINFLGGIDGLRRGKVWLENAQLPMGSPSTFLCQAPDDGPPTDLFGDLLWETLFQNICIDTMPWRAKLVESLHDFLILLLGRSSLTNFPASLLLLLLEVRSCLRDGTQTRLRLATFLLNKLSYIFQFHRFLTRTRISQCIAHGPGGLIHLSSITISHPMIRGRHSRPKQNETNKCRT